MNNKFKSILLLVLVFSTISLLGQNKVVKKKPLNPKTKKTKQLIFLEPTPIGDVGYEEPPPPPMEIIERAVISQEVSLPIKIDIPNYPAGQNSFKELFEFRFNKPTMGKVFIGKIDYEVTINEKGKVLEDLGSSSPELIEFNAE
jgi:hypothetical protein